MGKVVCARPRAIILTMNKQIPVIIFGAGGVGRALLQQIVEGRETVATRNQLYFNVVAVADSRRWLWQPAGMADEQLLAVIQAKKTRQNLGVERPDGVTIIEQAAQAGLENGIVVDVTALEGMEPVLDKALAIGWGVVLANKKALAVRGRRRSAISTIRAYAMNRRSAVVSLSLPRCAICWTRATRYCVSRAR